MANINKGKYSWEYLTNGEDVIKIRLSNDFDDSEDTYDTVGSITRQLSNGECIEDKNILISLEVIKGLIL